MIACMEMRLRPPLNFPRKPPRGSAAQLNLDGAQPNTEKPKGASAAQAR